MAIDRDLRAEQNSPYLEQCKIPAGLNLMARILLNMLESIRLRRSVSARNAHHASRTECCGGAKLAKLQLVDLPSPVSYKNAYGTFAP